MNYLKALNYLKGCYDKEKDCIVKNDSLDFLLAITKITNFAKDSKEAKEKFLNDLKRG